MNEEILNHYTIVASRSDKHPDLCITACYVKSTPMDDIKHLEHLPLPFDANDKIFNLVDEETGEIISETYSYNDFLHEIESISGVNDELIEYGSSSPVGFANASMCDKDGNTLEIKCKCGNEASSVIIGKESYMGLCNKCQYGD